MLEQPLKTQKSVSDCIAEHGMGQANIVVTFKSNVTAGVRGVLCPLLPTEVSTDCGNI